MLLGCVRWRGYGVGLELGSVCIFPGNLTLAWGYSLADWEFLCGTCMLQQNLNLTHRLNFSVHFTLVTSGNKNKKALWPAPQRLSLWRQAKGKAPDREKNKIQTNREQHEHKEAEA